MKTAISQAAHTYVAPFPFYSISVSTFQHCTEAVCAEYTQLHGTDNEY
jgi:hypothetical protein